MLIYDFFAHSHSISYDFDWNILREKMCDTTSSNCVRSNCLRALRIRVTVAVWALTTSKTGRCDSVDKFGAYYFARVAPDGS